MRNNKHKLSVVFATLLFLLVSWYLRLAGLDSKILHL